MTQQNIEEKSTGFNGRAKELQDYKMKTKEKMAKYVIGGKDTIGNPIKRIFNKGDEFVIYEIDGVSSLGVCLTY